ncbi:PPOX class F420-dependent oxidoreductase [Litorihabitans aurantiacus]|uniref:Pyridoxamine 5'-phosphate oxidase N-terminal domain-containing protein n=1 Tax=Litorihabitans aurantiacus TaxID=1930061 RepID=A0AA37XHM7_9MICO|nr:PPOX class F420-dependent oxidoreductase [Litorihabitans aurantiacus]GMA33291.1 hypothetical protein GCM10025875_32830 [Litorihabitans aurantiacus]
MEPIADDAEWQRLARARFVSVGTVRRSGEVVRTPVWIAPLGDRLVLTSEVATGKIKRLRHTDRVVLRVCDRFGKIDPGDPELEGTGALVADEATSAAATRALRAKYGPQFTVVLAFERLVRRLQRRRSDRVIVTIDRR